MFLWFELSFDLLTCVKQGGQRHQYTHAHTYSYFINLQLNFTKKGMPATSKG